MISTLCGEGMEGLGNTVFFGLEAVFCVCWVQACQDMEWGVVHGSFGGVGALPKTPFFSGEPEGFVSVNLSASESGEERAGEELVVAPYPGRRSLAGRDYSSCRSVTGFYLSEIPFYFLGAPQFIYTNHRGNVTGWSGQDLSRVLHPT